MISKKKYLNVVVVSLFLLAWNYTSANTAGEFVQHGKKAVQNIKFEECPSYEKKASYVFGIADTFHRKNINDEEVTISLKKNCHQNGDKKWAGILLKADRTEKKDEKNDLSINFNGCELKSPIAPFDAQILEKVNKSDQFKMKVRDYVIGYTCLKSEPVDESTPDVKSLKPVHKIGCLHIEPPVTKIQDLRKQLSDKTSQLMKACPDPGNPIFKTKEDPKKDDRKTPEQCTQEKQDSTPNPNGEPRCVCLAPLFDDGTKCADRAPTDNDIAKECHAKNPCSDVIEKGTITKCPITGMMRCTTISLESPCSPTPQCPDKKGQTPPNKDECKNGRDEKGRCNILFRTPDPKTNTDDQKEKDRAQCIRLNMDYNGSHCVNRNQNTNTNRQPTQQPQQQQPKPQPKPQQQGGQGGTQQPQQQQMQCPPGTIPAQYAQQQFGQQYNQPYAQPSYTPTGTFGATITSPIGGIGGGIGIGQNAYQSGYGGPCVPTQPQYPPIIPTSTSPFLDMLTQKTSCNSFEIVDIDDTDAIKRGNAFAVAWDITTPTGKPLTTVNIKVTPAEKITYKRTDQRATITPTKIGTHTVSLLLPASQKENCPNIKFKVVK